MTIGVSWEYSRNKNYVGIVGECSENSTRIQWEYYRNSKSILLEILWQYFGKTPWEYHGNPLGVLWEQSGNMLPILWEPCGNSMRIPWVNLVAYYGNLREYYGNRTIIHQQYYRNTLGMAWEYHWEYCGNTLGGLGILWEDCGNRLGMLWQY